MLSIFALNKAKQAAKYYESDNYYHRGSVESIAATHWWGKGADLLGLQDYVDPQKFIELLEGRIDKDTILGRTRHDDGVEHKPGYDLTFSAPKSVSMLAEIGKDLRIYEAHNNAVNSALEYLQSRVAQYRHTVDYHTQVKKSDNLIVAKFRHDTSRSVEETIDCQLHTHCVVVNATMSQDGKWRSLHEKPLFDFKMVGGMIYRSALAMELKKLGYKIEKTREDGLFEVAGFSRNQIETFSQRRIKILEVMNDLGLFSAEAAEAVTLGLREQKAPIDRNKLDEHWQQRAQEANIDLGGFVKKSKARLKAGLVEEIPDVADKADKADKALQYAVDHLGERNSVFQEKDILKKALQYALGDIQVEDIHQALDRFKAQEKLVFLGTHRYRDLYTSPKVIAQENSIIEIMQNGKNECDPIASKEAVALYNKTLADSMPVGMKPTNCQLKAIDFLSTSTDRVAAIQGYAGTGKTTMLRAVCRIAEQAGYQIRGASPGASAADVLRSGTGITTTTLSGLLQELHTESRFLGRAQNLFQKKPELIILDEASMASTHQMYDLFKLAEKLNKRIFLIGDRKQLPAVENGDPFGLLQDKEISLATLTEIVRQKAKDLAFAVRETIHGDIRYALEAIGHEAFIEKNFEKDIEKNADGEALHSSKSSIEIINNKQERLDAIAQTYLSLDLKEQSNTIVLLGSNEDRQTINAIIRDGLKNGSVISNEEATSYILQNKGFTAVEKTHIDNYTIGDVVRFNKAYRSLGIKRFSYLKVIGIDADREELILAMVDRKVGKEVCWKPEGSSRTKGGAVDVFIQASRTLASGDFIRWTQNRKNLDIYNTETAKVVSVSGDVAQVKIRNGKTINLDLTKSIDRHWDYAWSSTVYAAQGKKALNVIAQLEGSNPHLTNYRAFYVTLSRAVNSIQLFVDDLDKSIKTIIKHTGEKSNATEFLISHKEKHLFEQHLKTAYLKLDGNIHEQTNELERLDKLAAHYVDAMEKNKVHLVAVDFKDRMRLNALIREGLKRKSRLSKEDIIVNTLRKYRVHSNDDRMKLTKGVIITFDRGYKKLGVNKGDSFSLDSIDELTGKAYLDHLDVNKNEKQVVVDIAFLVDRQDKEVEICKQDQLALAVGDEILWTKTYKNDGLIQGQAATVTDINKDKIVLELQNRRQVTFGLNDPRTMHWSYAYAKNLDAPTPKKYDIALAHLDERTKLPARVEAIFGAMGKAEKGAHIYTHSKHYVMNQLKLASQQDINLQTYADEEIKKEVYDILQKFEQSKRTVSKAWVNYFESKKAGQKTKEKTEEILRNALILDRAHSELAHKITTDPCFDQEKTKALGFNIDHLQKYTRKQEVISIVDKYETSQGILRGFYAREIATYFEDFKRELQNRNINKEAVLEEKWDYVRRAEKLKLTPEERHDRKIVDTYFEYSREARDLWKKIFRTKDEGKKPDHIQFNFANHLSKLRNELAQDITTHPGRFEQFTQHLQLRTKNRIKEHAQKYKQHLKNRVERNMAIQTRDWRQVVEYEQGILGQQQAVQYQYSNKNKKVYWDKDQVLSNVIPIAEQIISALIAEEKNTRLSRDNKIVWGKKHGSVHLHLSGTKEGVVNDYERGIHGDIITYYAKSRGIDWYDALSELAAEAGLNPDSAGIKPISVKPEVQAKKERAILKEQKRRSRARNLAQKIWYETQPIKNTLVEKYLKKHRSINIDVENLEIRYHPTAPAIVSYKGEELKIFDRRPAMVVSFRNNENELTGIQCTYLDKETANKDKTVKIGKNTIGQIWGSAGLIYRGGDEKVIVAEGCETAASLVSVAKEASIYITGGNMQNAGSYDFLAIQHNLKNIHIAADNDLSFEAGSWKATEAASRRLASSGISSLVSRPEAIKENKTDYNDVLKNHGEIEVEKQFVPTFTIEHLDKVTDKTKLSEIQIASSHVKQKETQIKNIQQKDNELLYSLPDM